MGSNMSKWDDFQEENGKWADETFGPNVSQDAIIAHLKKEVEELAQYPDSAYEYADCMILLLDAAKRVGISASFLLECCKDKLEINRKRKWGPPDKDGVIEHIKDIVCPSCGDKNDLRNCFRECRDCHGEGRI